jgi:hypothetical protein
MHRHKKVSPVPEPGTTITSTARMRDAVIPTITITIGIRASLNQLFQIPGRKVLWFYKLRKERR